MTPKERLQQALNHQEGAIPVDLGGSVVTGIHCETLMKLREALGLERRAVVVDEPVQMLGRVDDDLREALGIDTTSLWNYNTQPGSRLERFKEWTTPWGQEVLVPDDFNAVTTDSGDTYAYPQGDMSVPPCMHMPAGGKFFDAINRQTPYDEDALVLEDNTEEFTLIDDATLQALGRRVAEIQDSGYGVLGSFGGTAFGDIALVPGLALKHPRGIRGVADWYMLLASDPAFVRKIFDRQLEVGIESLKRVYSVVGDTPDAVFVCGTDFGTQIGTFCSVDTFRALYKPYYQKVNDWIHTNTKWKTFKHSCGAVADFIPEFIDCGFDVLNPVQWSAAGMDRETIKRKYGDDIVFWGGGINTQKTLPFGTVEEVYQETLACCRDFGKHGGFVFNPIHNIQAKVPPENIIRMFEAVRDYNKG